MTPDEIRTTYEELAKILARSGLGWVVEQVEHVVHAGRAVERPTRIFRDGEGKHESASAGREHDSARRSGKPTVMMTLEPWPERDRLLFLIDGVRHAIVHASSVENDQVRLLREVGHVARISFVTDEISEDRAPLNLVGVRDDRIQTLSGILSDLERQVMRSVDFENLAQRVARLANEEYLQARSRGSQDVSATWDQLPNEVKSARVGDVLRVFETLEETGLVVEEGPSHAEETARAAEVTNDRLETLAEAEHNVWLEQRRQAGWTYGPIRNDQIYAHNLLVAWDQLPPDAQDSVRRLVRSYLSYALQAGFRFAPARSEG